MGLKELDKGLDYLKVASCIDYFEFIIIGEDWSTSSSIFVQLCKILKTNPTEYIDYGSNKYFSNVYIFDADIYLHINPRSENQVEEPYYKIQMAGDACRHFEQRGGNWLDLFKYIKSVRHKVKHIDLACDDFYYIDLEQLKEFIQKRWFISNFRCTCREKYVPAEDIDSILDGVEFNDKVYPLIDARDQREGLSYSATWGTRQSLQFQIYDKMQERKHKGYDVIGDHWIRFEIRIYDDRAEIVFNHIIDDLENNTFSDYIARLLYGLIDFKEGAFDYAKSKYHRLNTWQPYLDFLGGLQQSDKIKIKPPVQQVDIERVMAKKRRWFRDSVAKSGLMLFAEDPNIFLSEFQDFMADKVKKGKFTYRDAAIVNYGRMYKGKGVLTFADYKEFFESNLGVRPGEEDKSQDDYFFEEDLPF